MKFCSKCGKQILDEAIVCMGCGCPIENSSSSMSLFGERETDVVSVGLCILSAFIPLFGIIYWAVKHRDTPKRARACGITGIVSWVLSFLFSMIFFTAVFSSMLYY